jgi:hypothetical protein
MVRNLPNNVVHRIFAPLPSESVAIARIHHQGARTAMLQMRTAQVNLG